MLNKEKAMQIEYMIRKELGRFSLVELCESWEIDVDDFDEFLDCAFKYVALQD